jgi:AraC-like DNA-binding protein
LALSPIEDIKSITDLEQKRKQFVHYFIVSIISLLSSLAVLFYFLDLKTVAIVFSISIVLISYIYFNIISKFSFDFKALTDIGFAFFTFLIYINALLFWRYSSIIYLFFFFVPLAVYIINGFKSMINWSIIIILCSLSTPFVADLLNIHVAIQLSSTQSIILNFTIIIWSVYLLVFFLYYHSEFDKLKNRVLPLKMDETGIKNIVHHASESPDKSESMEVEESESSPAGKEEYVFSEKYSLLFIEIEHYFEEKAPYQNPDFNIHQLVIDLKTNSRYVSNALHQKNGGNFKSYLNNYRIKEVKKKLDKKEHELYTLKHIYNSVGFTNQSTFNRIFKEVEGTTPSEYIENLK